MVEWVRNLERKWMNLVLNVKNAALGILIIMDKGTGDVLEINATTNVFSSPHKIPLPGEKSPYCHLCLK